MKFAILSSLLLASSQANPTYSSYTTGSDVVQHGQVDLDMKKIIDQIALDTEGGRTAAKNVYLNGENSVKSSGNRKLQDFGNAAASGKMGGTEGKVKEFHYSLFKGAGYSDGDYDVQTIAVLSGNDIGGGFYQSAALSILFRNTFSYTMHEFLDAFYDKVNDSLSDNDNSVKAWDEGVAFFSGSLIETVAGNSANVGKGTYYSLYGWFETIGAKFAQDANGDSGECSLNIALMAKFNEGKVLIDDKVNAFDAAKQEELLVIIDDIHALITRGLIQSYIWIQDAGWTADQKAVVTKAIGNALHGEVNACSGVAGGIVKSNLVDADGAFAETLAALQGEYRCLKTSCGDVGVFTSTSGDKNVPACNDLEQYPFVVGDGVSQTVAGYVPGSNVAAHSVLDKDLVRIGIYMAQGDQVNAYRAYSEGRNSVKGSGSVRSYQKFSVGASLMDFKYQNEAETYFGCDPDASTACYWNDNFISAVMLGGTDNLDSFDYSVADTTARKELAVKSIMYSTAHMYVWREFYDAVADCKIGTTDANQDGVHAWDEGVVFWAGSLEGATTAGNSAGQLLMRLGVKRSGNYEGTQADDGSSKINNALLAQFGTARDYLVAGKCTEAEAMFPAIFSNMITPIIQGAQRYAHKVHDDSTSTKSRAEGWAFARAVLPFINECNTDSAAIITKNQAWNAATPMVDGEDAVFEAYQKTYECLGITCEMMGELSGAPACKDDFPLGGSAAKAGFSSMIAVVAGVIGYYIM